ncbi:N-acetylmuramoyl-L-alanine amidase [Streptomyces sp. 4R-3d]|uniref:N-acetylmuramoyl-L-alanine amidase n=1 Tax=Streptomyces sp. 4R-3d TaxID=2559605 RepID=UPI001071EA5B|nr:N-acetylmuramoyl-L-alanine amidase [Streptomyces sp. 4R-3d]TFI30176.1 hypothetical protein E4P36_05370 [Streptomyces sp. 4R-3d]
MARTGPQKIPGASQAYFYGNGQYSGSAMEVNCGVVHTTEGRTVPSYNNGAMAPTVTGLPDFKAKKIRWYQHYDVDESARALANKLGGVETNTANTFQIELVGTCDDKYKTGWSGKKAGVDYLHWPTAPDWALAEVAWLVKWLNTNHGIPLTGVRDWLAYGKDSRRPGVTPASYGASPARMSHAAWRNFKGWCGHQHVPENDHGDPGNLDFARVLAHATGSNPPEEDDVALSSSDIEKVADAVVLRMLSKDAFPAPTDAADYKPTGPGSTWSGRTVFRDLITRVRRISADTAAIRKKLGA